MPDLTIIILVLVFLIILVLSYLAGMKIGSIRRDKYWETELPHYKKEAIEKSRAVLGGQFSEQLSPYLPDFKYIPTECKFLGKPIDFIVFNGLDSNDLREIVFLEVKSGNAKLSSKGKKIKEIIKSKRVRWEEYRVPEELTKKEKFV